MYRWPAYGTGRVEPIRPSRSPTTEFGPPTLKRVTTEPLDLPADFVFGTSTASYQIEGAVSEGGRGRSVWDDFCERPGAIRDGSSGAVADDHYHRWAADVDLMAGLGIAAYRFSIAWPRVQPDGAGAINPEGLGFYDRLVDALCAKGIKPAATLFHWDLPSALEARGGWLDRETALRFGDYTTAVAERLADRVAIWFPVNEPQVVMDLGYARGIHAPGRTLGADALPVAHHLLLGHGLAVERLRAAGARSVGSACNLTPAHPTTGSDADRAAAAAYAAFHNELFVEPILAGSYPEGYAERMPGPVEEDLRVIHAPLDLFGMNYYFPTALAAPDAGHPAEIDGIPARLVPFATPKRTDFDWPVYPQGLLEILRWLRDRFGDGLPPVHITENGAAYAVGPGIDGLVHDQQRIDYLDAHLRAVVAARAEGIDVAGYFLWSLLDNFEWAEGYLQRFGIVHVDYTTQARTPKDSYAWYRDTIAQVRSRA